MMISCTPKSQYSIYLVNASTKMPDDVLRRIASACNKQLARHVYPAWELAPQRVYSRRKGQGPVKGQWNILILDDLDSKTSYGWHSDSSEAGVHGEVGCNVWLDHGGTLTDGAESISNTISHEVVEIYGNPNVNAWRDSGYNWQMAQELCDPVQAQTYKIDGISVSNFVFPEFFDPTPYDNTFDYLRYFNEPFQCAPGGYFVWRRGSEEHQYFAQDVPQWRRELRSARVARPHRVQIHERDINGV